MGQKNHPYATRLGVSLPWFSSSYISSSNVQSILQEEKWIREIVNGINLKFDILTSEVVIIRKPNTILISYGYFKGEKSLNLVTYIIELITLILKKKFNVNIQYKLIEIDNINSNSKILADYLTKELTKDPNNYKQLISRILNLP
jgi:ribosomal protein S3